MKKIIIAIIAIAGLVHAGEYAVTKPIALTQHTTTTVTATLFRLERFSAIVDRDVPIFLINGSYLDANGNLLERKTIRVTMEQAAQIMPDIATIMSNAQAAVAAYIDVLLAE